MSKPHINHLSLNTGYCVSQTDNNFHMHSTLGSKFLALAQKSLQPGGAEVIGNITFEARRIEDSYIGILFSNIDGKKIPLLTTFGARKAKSGKVLWELLQGKPGIMPAADSMEQCRPHVPFVADFVHDDCLPDIHAYNFFYSGKSEDFCKCIGWAFLFPETFDGCPDMAGQDDSTGASRKECPDVADMMQWLAAMAGASAHHELQARLTAMGITYIEEWLARTDSIRKISDLIKLVKWATPLLDGNLEVAGLDRYLASIKECPDERESLKWLVAAKGHPGMDGGACRAEMMDEACRRMEMLGLKQEVIRSFQESGKLDSAMEDGHPVPLDEADLKRIQKYEDTYGYLAYAAVRGRIEQGRVISYIMVSPRKEDWPMDRAMLQMGTVLAYVYNYNIPVYSESGNIAIERLPGGMLKKI